MTAASAGKQVHAQDEAAAAAAEPQVAMQGFEAWLIGALRAPRLPLRLALLAVALSSPCLLLGYYADDWVARYIYTDLEGAQKLFRLYNGGYGIANGVPADTHWQIEQGWAPWWTYEHLHIRMFRPLGLLSHLLDAYAWPDSPALMRAHSLLWLAALVLAATRMYRGALGALCGAMAALLFAVDHTRGFAVGYITNRHALMAVTFGVLCLDQRLRADMHGERKGHVLGPLLYGVALLCSDAAVAICGYLGAYGLLAERGGLWKRALGLAPYAAVTVAWLAYYKLGGYGASGSGLYIDPAREPAQFSLAFLERAPLLVLGLFLAPPAEVHSVAPAPVARAMLVFAVLVLAGLLVALAPLLRRDRNARFWAAGLLLSLVPASSAFPHNRQLLFASLGAMPLLAQLWHLYAIELRDAVLAGFRRAARAIAGIAFFMHLFVSPWLVPFATCGVALLAPLQRGLADGGADLGGRDVVFMTAPDYLAVRIVQLERRVEHEPLPRRWRALSFGPQRVTVVRSDARTLELTYEGGILGTPFMELYRDRRLAMTPGQRVELQGLRIEVLAVTGDGRAERVRFSFDAPLDAPSFRFYAWLDGRFERYTPPRIGQRDVLPAAHLELDWN
jgi:hypothetical protein